MTVLIISPKNDLLFSYLSQSKKISFHFMKWTRRSSSGCDLLRHI